MALSPAFIDQVRERTTLSTVIGRSVKLTKAGREFKACCPFHGEKTPSFTVNDDKGFYHCFGCGAHGDVFRWLADHDGTPFVEAVAELAQAAGLDLPAPDPQAHQRAARAATVREALDAAQAIFVRQLEQTGAAMEYLAARGIGPDEVSKFGLGYARGGDGSLRGSGIGRAVGREAGLLVPRPDDPAQLREQFWDRITVPIHDGKGRLIGFGGRVWPGRKAQEPKFVNSPETPLFDKGRNLFNLHRAAPLARPAAENRLVIVEGYFDVTALDRAGIGAAVAPLGTALTERQLELAWRAHHRPTLLFDGDSAGQRAALRACRTALPLLGPGRELAVALLPPGQDPDDLVRAGAVREIEAALIEARGVAAFLFDQLVAGLPPSAARAPEQVAAIWAELSELAGAVRDDETRAQYLGQWRARYDRECSALPVVATDERLHAAVLAEGAEPGGYAWPESESESAARLIALARRVVKLRAERREITAEIADTLKMAEAIGFNKKELTAVIRDIESDLANGSAVREEAEMVRVLYRRTLGVRGPLDEAMLPQAAEPRARAANAQIKRRAAQYALIEARAVEV